VACYGAALDAFGVPHEDAGADLAAAGLRPLVEILARLFGLGGTITASEGGWSVATGLTRGGQPVDYALASDVVRRMLLGVPLTAALLLAPPRARPGWKGVAISIVTLAIVFALSIVGYVWGELTPLLNPDRAGGAPSGAPLDQPPLSAVGAQVAVLARYIGFAVAPLVTAVILWASFSPLARRTLLGDFAEPTDEAAD